MYIDAYVWIVQNNCLKGDAARGKQFATGSICKYCRSFYLETLPIFEAIDLTNSGLANSQPPAIATTVTRKIPIPHQSAVSREVYMRLSFRTALVKNTRNLWTTVKGMK